MTIAKTIVVPIPKVHKTRKTKNDERAKKELERRPVNNNKQKWTLTRALKVASEAGWKLQIGNKEFWQDQISDGKQPNKCKLKLFDSANNLREVQIRHIASGHIMAQQKVKKIKQTVVSQKTAYDLEADSYPQSIWRDANGFSDYQVADITINGDQGIVRKKDTGRLVSQFSVRGYKRVNLRTGNKKQCLRYVHQLTIVGSKPGTEMTVDHIISTDICNNYSTNLRWASKIEQRSNQTPKIMRPKLEKVCVYLYNTSRYHLSWILRAIRYQKHME